jgi:type II secretory pathway component PulF
LDTAAILDGLSLAAGRNVAFRGELEILGRWYPRPSIRERLRSVLRDLDSGADWCRSLARHGLIKQAEMAVLEAAQRAGNLAWALREMADSSRRRLNYRLYALLQVLFPLVILAFGALVFVFVAAYFMPMIALISRLT